MVDGDLSTYGTAYFGGIIGGAIEVERINLVNITGVVIVWTVKDGTFKDLEVYAEDTNCGTCRFNDDSLICYIFCYPPVKGNKVFIKSFARDSYWSLRIYEITVDGNEISEKARLSTGAIVWIVAGAIFLVLILPLTIQRCNRRKTETNQFNEHFTERYAIDSASEWLKRRFFQGLYEKYRLARLRGERNGHLEVDRIYLKESTKWTIRINHDTAGRSRSRVEFQVIRIENDLCGKTIVWFNEIDLDGPREFLLSRINICQEFELAREASSVDDSRRREDAWLDNARREENGEENRRGEEVRQVEEVSRQAINTTAREQPQNPSAPQILIMAPPSYETYRNSNVTQPHDNIPTYEEVMANSNYFPEVK